MEEYANQVREQIRNDRSYYLLLLSELEYYHGLLEDKNLPPGCRNPIHARVLREETFRRYQEQENKQKQD